MLRVAAVGGAALAAPQVVRAGMVPAFAAESSPMPCDDPNQLLIVGDSWANRAFNDLAGELATPDRVVLNLGNEGAEASEYAVDANGYLTEAKTALGNVGCGNNVVALSLGGNDIRDTFLGAGAQAFNDIAADLQTVIDCMVAVDPSVKIWLTGYDILNAQSLVCAIAAFVFAGGTSPQAVNAILSGLDVMYASVAAANPNVCYQSSLGTLQGSPGAPDFNNWSPQALVDFDCIHLTPAGWDLWAAQLATFL